MTFLATRVTCPRCLVAMEYRERGKINQLYTPEGWHLDDRRAIAELARARESQEPLPLG